MTYFRAGNASTIYFSYQVEIDLTTRDARVLSVYHSGFYGKVAIRRFLLKTNDPKSAPIERRKYPRAQFHESVTVHNVVESKSGNVFEVQGNPLMAKAKDVSEGGIRLEAAQGGPQGKIFKLNFQIQKGKTVDIYSKLAWTEAGMLGLQFIVADEQIRRYIRSFVEKSK